MRVILLCEFVDFFELYFFVLIILIIFFFGVVIMLLWIEFWIGIVCLIIVVILMCFVLSYVSKNEIFYRWLNNCFEKEVDYVNKVFFGVFK